VISKGIERAAASVEIVVNFHLAAMPIGKDASSRQMVGRVE
jgi:hypothetical protein